jgi:lipoprotein-releasing system permease protein
MVFEFFRKYLFSPRAGAVIRKVSWLTVIGLGLSVTALIVVLSVMTALNHNIEDRTLAIEPHLTIQIPGVDQALLLEAHPLTAKLREHPEVKVDVFESQDVILRTLDGHFKGAVARGVTQQSLDRMLQEMQKLDVKKKDLPYAPETLAAGEVIIGVDLAVALGVFEGDQLMVIPPEELLLPPTETPKYEKVTVRKIISTSLADVDAQGLFYVRGLALKSFKKAASKKTYIEVKVPNPYNMEPWKKELTGFPEARVETWRERNSALFFALKLEKMVISLFLGLAALIASFSMVSVLALLISQKRREIGILQAIGFSQKRVQRLFLQIGFALAMVGLGVGILIGSGISIWIEIHPLNILPDIYYDSQIPADWDPLFVLNILLAGVALALGGSYLISRNASLDSPADKVRRS